MSQNRPENIAYLALGSNVGDRLARLMEAEKLLEEAGIQIAKKSQIYETEPWPKHQVLDGRPTEEGGQNWHLNQVLQVQTHLDPENLLKLTQKIEKEMGKMAKPVWGSREIDIDILLYSQDLVDLPELEIPHRHMYDRQFVLVPLLQIDPEICDPRSGRSFKDFLDEIKDNHKVVSFL